MKERAKTKTQCRFKRARDRKAARIPCKTSRGRPRNSKTKRERDQKTKAVEEHASKTIEEHATSHATGNPRAQSKGKPKKKKQERNKEGKKKPSRKPKEREGRKVRGRGIAQPTSRALEEKEPGGKQRARKIQRNCPAHKYNNNWKIHMENERKNEVNRKPVQRPGNPRSAQRRAPLERFQGRNQRQ